jgi:hypothetical protein
MDYAAFRVLALALPALKEVAGGAEVGTETAWRQC